MFLQFSDSKVYTALVYLDVQVQIFRALNAPLHLCWLTLEQILKVKNVEYTADAEGYSGNFTESKLQIVNCYKNSYYDEILPTINYASISYNIVSHFIVQLYREANRNRRSERKS